MMCTKSQPNTEKGVTMTRFNSLLAVAAAVMVASCASQALAAPYNLCNGKVEAAEFTKANGDTLHPSNEYDDNPNAIYANLQQEAGGKKLWVNCLYSSAKKDVRDIEVPAHLKSCTVADEVLCN